MDFDATIERLNALKLQDRSTNGHQQQTAQLQQEVRRLQEHSERQAQHFQLEMRELQTRLEASEHQNQLLKAALGELDTYRHQAETQQLVIDELQAQVKQLRLTNIRLQYVVQQNEPRGQGTFLPPPPPDIF
jgi:hypothetical protein